MFPNESSLRNLYSNPLVAAKLKTDIFNFLHAYRWKDIQVSISAEIFFEFAHIFHCKALVAMQVYCQFLNFFCCCFGILLVLVWFCFGQALDRDWTEFA